MAMAEMAGCPTTDAASLARESRQQLGRAVVGDGVRNYVSRRVVRRQRVCRVRWKAACWSRSLTPDRFAGTSRECECVQRVGGCEPPGQGARILCSLIGLSECRGSACRPRTPATRPALGWATLTGADAINKFGGKRGAHGRPRMALKTPRCKDPLRCMRYNSSVIVAV